MQGKSIILDLWNTLYLDIDHAGSELRKLWLMLNLQIFKNLYLLKKTLNTTPALIPALPLDV